MKLYSREWYQQEAASQRGHESRQRALAQAEWARATGPYRGSAGAIEHAVEHGRLARLHAREAERFERDALRASG